MAHQDALDFLNTDPLRHLVQLKYLHLYPDTVECIYMEQGASRGVLVSHPVQAIIWDRALYPDAHTVFLPVASDAVAARLILDHILAQTPADRPNVFKFCEPEARRVIGEVFPLRHARTFVSYTNAPGATFEPDPAVRVRSGVDEACLPLFAANGYTADEVGKYVADGAWSFAIYDATGPICACMTYRNFGAVWEIGGVHTVERARRQGYARRVVQTALATLLSQGRVPRYQVADTNRASVLLAEDLALRVCLRFEHCVV